MASKKRSRNKQKGNLAGVHSFSVEDELRILVDLEDKLKSLLADIESHDEVY